ncbi:MAG: outer membrane protein assembly factor BamC [Parahaliea sp.]
MKTAQRLNRISRVGLCLTLAGLGGCGYLLHDKSQDYRHAHELPVMDVPGGESSASLHEIYPVPAVRDDVLSAEAFSVPRPISLTASAGEERVRIQSLGEESWALVSIAPGQLWPEVRGFLSAAGVQVSRVDARSGIIETNWLQFEDKTMASRFRFRIDQGVQRGTSELHVLQMNQAGDIDSWPPQSDDNTQEQDMLKAVAQYVANSSESAPVSMIADQAMGASGKISLHEADAGYTYIRMGLSYSRAWASLGKALADAGFEITDKDRSAGRYYLRYQLPEEDKERGWFSWFSSDDNDHPWFGKDYEAWISQDGNDAVTIRMVGDNDPDFDRKQEQAMLSLVKGHLS